MRLPRKAALWRHQPSQVRGYLTTISGGGRRRRPPPSSAGGGGRCLPGFSTWRALCMPLSRSVCLRDSGFSLYFCFIKISLIRLQEGSLLTVPDHPRIIRPRGADGEDGKKWTKTRPKGDARERRNTKGKRTPLRSQEPWDE